MKYFVNYPYTAESLKSEYRELCKKLHPDTGGNAQDFAEMMNEYEQTARNLNGTTTANKARTAAADDTTAQDFADLMGAPLKGTKGKTFADLVAELADIMADDDRRSMYESEGETWGCYGWDGCSMTPESRTAYIKKFGRTVVEMAELCATMKQAADAKAYEQTHHAAHVREARKNQSEGNKAPKAGAFVFGVGCDWKSDGGRGVFVNFEAFAHNPEEYGTQYDDEKRRHLCKVCEVYEVSAEDFNRPELADELVKKAHDEGRKFAGGSATEDPEPAENPRDPYARYKYYYTLCAAVVCRESGRWYLIDSEGHEYARYTYMPTSWRTMYADEISEAQRKQAERDEQERQEEERKAAEKLAEYREKCKKYEAAGLEDLTEYREAVKTANREESEAGRAHGWRSAERKAAGKRAQAAAAALMAAEKRNIKRMAETAYPGIKCKVTKADSWRSYGYKLTYEDGPTLETFQNNTDFDLFAAYWEEYRMDDCTELHRHDLTEFADKYGDGHGVEIAREMSKAERERMTAAILQAVPAAAGICWENRHAWTQEEVTAAAAAVGVDGWELWKVYDHKHTYFNYVTAESLAEWAHELTAYDIKGKKTRKTSAQSESKPQETTTAAETDNTPQATAEAVTTDESNGDGLRMEQYSEKATVIRGYNEQQAAELEAMGGKEWRNLRGGKGYIFSTRRHADELAEWMKQQQGEGTAAPAADEQAATASESEPEALRGATLQEIERKSDRTAAPAWMKPGATFKRTTSDGREVVAICTRLLLDGFAYITANGCAVVDHVAAFAGYNFDGLTPCDIDDDAPEFAHMLRNFQRIRKEFEEYQTAHPYTEQGDTATASEGDTLHEAEDITDTTTDTTDESEPEAADLSPVLQAFADFFGTLSDIMQQAKQWEGVTVPAATLARWKQEAEDGTKTAAARLCEVCACLASLTPDSRRDFDALGAIFWSLSEQIRNGYDPDTLQAATDYARAQLFDLIDRTQTENQARAVREANRETSESKAGAPSSFAESGTRKPTGNEQRKAA